jgi:hypothetical protein
MIPGITGGLESRSPVSVAQRESIITHHVRFFCSAPDRYDDEHNSDSYESIGTIEETDTAGRACGRSALLAVVREELLAVVREHDQLAVAREHDQLAVVRQRVLAVEAGVDVLAL